MSACAQCMVAGPACGPATGVAEQSAPCCLCGAATLAVTPCGAARAFRCGGGPGHRFVAPATPVATVAAGPAAQRAGLRWRAAEARRAGTPQPKLADELVERGLSPAEARRGVELWNSTMRSIPYRGAHMTAVGILNGTLNHSQIPALPEPEPGALAPLEAPGARVWTKRAWDVYGRLAPPDGPSWERWHLTGWDVHAMYLSAAAIELGTGSPVDREWPDESAVLAEPGFVQVAALEKAPWSMGDHWSESMWVPTPLATYWRDRGAEFLVPRSLTWPTHRRWLDPHVDLLRKARAELLADGSPVAAELGAVVKDIYARMFGGLLVSEDYNRGRTLRPDWRSMVIGTAQARMFRGLDAMAGLVSTVVGVHIDCAWIVMPAAYEQPPGLVVSDQPGKFHLTGRTPWTPELRAAWQDARHDVLWAALDAAKPE